VSLHGDTESDDIHLGNMMMYVYRSDDVYIGLRFSRLYLLNEGSLAGREPRSEVRPPNLKVASMDSRLSTAGAAPPARVSGAIGLAI